MSLQQPRISIWVLDTAYIALNNKEHCYGGTEGTVNFYPKSYKYVNTS